MTGCNYPNWNLARTHLLFAKRAGDGGGGGRGGCQGPQAPLKLPAPQGSEPALAAPQRPLTKLGASAGTPGSKPFLTLHTLPLSPRPSLPPRGATPSWVIRNFPDIKNFPLRDAWPWVWQSGLLAGSYLCLSVCLAHSVRLSPDPAVFLLS